MWPRGSEAITQPVSQCFPDDSRGRRLPPWMQRREGEAAGRGQGGKELFGSLCSQSWQGGSQSYFPSLTSGFFPQVTILEAFSSRTRIAKTPLTCFKSPGNQARELWEAFCFIKARGGSPPPTLPSDKARKCDWRWGTLGARLEVIESWLLFAGYGPWS